MDGMLQLVLTVGLILISAYSIKVSQESVQAVNQMSQQMQMMFVKS